MTFIIGRLESKRVDALFKRMNKAIRNWRPALQEIGDMLEASVDENFEAEGRPEPWPDLSPTTEAARAERGTWPGKLGTDTAGLVSSISSSVSGLTVTVSHGKEYGDYFHFGTWQNVTAKQQIWLVANLGLFKEVGEDLVNPPRPFMVVQDEDMVEAEQILVDHLMKAL